MITIAMEFECGCFKRSGYDSKQTFATKAEAIERAEEMVEDMNESFCGAHNFRVIDKGDDVIIGVGSNF